MSFLGIFQKIAALVLALVTVLSGTTAGSVIGFTDGTPIKATRRNYCFDNDRLLIGGYNINEKNKTEEAVKYAKEAGLDFVIANGNEKLLTLCDRYGLGVIATGYTKNAPYVYWSASEETFGKWSLITNDSYNYTHPSLWGDNLIDEPTASVFPYISKACNSYYNNVNGKLPFVNLFPIYANDEQLGNTCTLDETAASVFWRHDDMNERINSYKQHVSDYINTIDTDYICVDIYPLDRQVKKDGTVTLSTYNLWLRNLDILSEACRKTNRDLWVITQATGQTNTESGKRFCDTPEDIRWQAYTSLAFGAKAIIHACYNGGWWNTDSHLIDSNGNRTDTYYAVQKADKELSAFADIYGKYEHKGAYLENGILAAGNLTHTLITLDDKYKPETETLSPVLIGAFTEKDGDGKAYSVVNMWEPNTKLNAPVKLTFPGVEEITYYRKGVETTVTGDILNITLETGEGIFVTVK